MLDIQRVHALLAQETCVSYDKRIASSGLKGDQCPHFSFVRLNIMRHGRLPLYPPSLLLPRRNYCKKVLEALQFSVTSIIAYLAIYSLFAHRQWRELIQHELIR
jgi:hypothetical protein